MIILNLGCGVKASNNTDVINIDWSIYLVLKKNPISRILMPFLLRGIRLERFNSISDNIMVHNLSKGIPFSDNSIDAIYHSHLLEHIDRDKVDNFLLETKRVLKSGGVQRVVVPDFELASRSYQDHIELCKNYPEERKKHDDYISNITEQSVRRMAFGSRQQPRISRFFENLILGDARRRGETHQWMYDRINLTVIMEKIGYRKVTLEDYNTSRIPDWNRYGLDINENGQEYKQGSLYLEAEK